MTDFLNKILDEINFCLDNNTFIDVEKSTIELKDLSTGSEWTSLKQTVCAFLNTNGGYIICGVRERDNKYKFTGFKRTYESKLLDLNNKTFQNDYDLFIDLSDFIQFEYHQFREGEIAIIQVSPLRDFCGCTGADEN